MSRSRGGGGYPHVYVLILNIKHQIHVFFVNIKHSNPVIAVYVPPEDTEDMWDELSETWKEKHLLQSQYFLQITKCDDQSCCRPYRSSIRAILPGRFIPPPVPVKQTRHGLVAPAPDETLIDSHYGSLFSRIALSAILPQCAKTFKIFPFDLYCPSLIGKLQPRICPVCGMYFPSQKAKSSHTKLHTGAKFVEVSKRIDEEDLDTITSSVQKDLAIPVDSLPIIHSVQEWATVPWIEEN
ncbi:hypothetical protein EB796_001237 [Bugula neritina]|uniref:C2H2-type domain-containing protein n=1 Tax=Bugula neritina TaxID=10212 RepID=A0A7J7KQT7_BUGNE|nr:hypothetical protein EB796_001237 [Bugula neritina]